MKVASQRIKGGYTMELAIPTSYLEKMQGGPWKEFRLNLGINDMDHYRDKGSELWWKPRWHEPRNFAGSGTFVRGE